MPDIFVASRKNKPRYFPLHLFSTFIESPKEIRFRGQHRQEKIVLLLRRHWVTNLGWLTLSFILFILPVFGIPFFNLTDLLPFSVPINFVLVGIAFWYLATFGYILLNFLFWFFNVNIVTSERIIDVDFIYLLYNEITSTIISKVEDVTYKRGGFLGALFDFGNVFVQTAGTEVNIEFLSVPRPATVVKVITSLLQETT